MKKIILVVFTISIIFLVGCRDNYISIGEYNKLKLDYSNLVDTNNELEENNRELNSEVNTLENDLKLSKQEVEKYNNLIDNLDELLENVYYVYDDNGITYVYGTGFSVEYNGKYYLITAGHVVDGEWGIHKNLGFKDINNEWIYPELLNYEVTETTPDYAIYYSDKINNGLKYDLNNTEPDYRLGIDKVIKENNNWGELGSCGSPVIDLDGEVIGLHVGYFQDIDLVIKALE